MASGSRSSFVAVAGSIAAGKTGLVDRLAVALDATALREDVATNPYFGVFYDDPRRWAFHSQVAFAADALSRHAHATGEEDVVQDRTIFEVVDVFARLLSELGDLDTRELGLLESLRDVALELRRQPTVMIYLHAPPQTLLRRAAERGRPAERHLTLDYMQRLERHYASFAGDWTRCPVIPVDTTRRDLRADRELEILVSELQAVQED